MQIEQDETERKLLGLVTKDLINKLVESPHILQIKASAFEGTFKEKKFQVQILITRNEEDFLEDFQTEVLNDY